MTDDLSSHDDATPGTRRARARERALADALKWLMADPRGRFLMWQRLADAGVYRLSLAASPELTAFNEGRRDLGLRDLGLVQRHCPDQYVRMLAEARAGAGAFVLIPFDDDPDHDNGEHDGD